MLPTEIKCLSIGKPDSEIRYISIIDKSGIEYCFSLSPQHVRLLHADTL